MYALYGGFGNHEHMQHKYQPHAGLHSGKMVFSNWIHHILNNGNNDSDSVWTFDVN